MGGNHDLCVSFVNKPAHCIRFLGQSWPVVSSVKGWRRKTLIKRVMRVLAEWDTAWALAASKHGL